MDYGPAPEGAEHVLAWLKAHEAGFGHFIGGAFTKPRRLVRRRSIPRPAERSPASSQGTAADVDAAVAAARKACRHGRRFPATSARSISMRSRGISRSASASSRCSRRIDNGKPIREIARHRRAAGRPAFLPSRRLGRAGRERVSGQRPVGVCGQIIPWNFPLLMLAWKIAPALAAGNTVVLKPAEYHAADRARLRRDLPRGRPAAGRRQHRHRRRRDRRGAGRPSGRRQDRLHRLDRGRPRDPQGDGRNAARSSRWSSAASRPSSSSRMPISTARSKASSTPSGSTRARSAAPARACWCRKASPKRFYAKLRARMEQLRVGDPLDKSTDIGAIVAPVQLQRIRGWSSRGRDGGRDLLARRRAPCRRGLLLSRRRCSPTSSRPRRRARVEIFGPVLVAMTFRTPDEAVALANNTRYGLAASIWSENINRALEVAARIKAGVVWINSTNLFDAAAGFGGYRESGFGREGGREGMCEYLDAAKRRSGKPDAEGRGAAAPRRAAAPAGDARAGIDRTRQALHRRQAGAARIPATAMRCSTATGHEVGQAGLGNRKDIRNAVEAAAKAGGWGAATAHNRAQVLYYVAENLAARADEFAARLSAHDRRLAARGASGGRRRRSAAPSIYAGFADKYDGARPRDALPPRHLAMNEPWGVDGHRLSRRGAAARRSSRWSCRPSPWAIASSRSPPRRIRWRHRLLSVLDTRDVPAGVVNIVTGDARRAGQDAGRARGRRCALVCRRRRRGGKMVEALSAATSRRPGPHRPRSTGAQAEGREFLRRATQVKNIWTPYGE